MSDPKRATLITVGAPKSVKNNVTKTVRLTVNLEESNESKYPELNYKELVIAEERNKKLENGKTSGLDPFSDNDDDVERVAKRFEQKYGNNSTYGKKRRTKRDDFADIGAGYDENDSFIDNTDGYDEMIPPECDTLYGGFYINCGSLEFKTVPENALMSDDEQVGGRRNKRRISSSSSDEESSESSSESESQEDKEKVVVNGNVDSHNTEHRKKKNKKIDKNKAKKKQRTDSSAATSGKQTSDDHGDAESADSRTSQSDSLTSKPAPSSENAITSDSSRDVESKQEVKLPQAVNTVLEELEAAICKYQADHPGNTTRDMGAKSDPYVVRLERTMNNNKCVNRIRRVVWTRAARSLGLPRTKLLHKVKALTENQTDSNTNPTPNTSTIAQTTATSTIVSTTLSTKTSTNSTTKTTTTNSTSTKPTIAPITKSMSNPVVSSKSASNPVAPTKSNSMNTTINNNKRKHEDEGDKQDFSKLTNEQREEEITKTIERLKQLIDERKPSMIANYNAECERVQEERKKLQIASGEGGTHSEKRLPKRRFPWCNRSRGLLARLKNLAGDSDSAASLLAQRVLPLFPSGFVRMPTLLKQTDLKDVKIPEIKRPRVNSTVSLPAAQTQPGFTEPIHFPSSLTVTTHVKSPEKDVERKDPKKTALGTIFNSFTVKDDDRKQTEKKEDLYIPPNSIGSITITAVPNNPTKEKKINNNVAIEKHKEPLIRVKSPAALNDMVNKDSQKKNIEKEIKEKRDNGKDTPLYIDTNCQPQKKDPSPKNKEDTTVKQIENLKKSEDSIPRPGLVPVHHSPTFVKPDKRPPEIKKKKDIVIVSDVDPLADMEPLAVDDSSSDVEVIEEKTTLKSDNNIKSDKNDGVVTKSDKKKDTVPSVDKSVVRLDSKDSINKSVNKELPRVKRIDVSEEKTAFDAVMRNLMQMEANSQSQPDKKSNSNNFKSVITSEQPSLNKTDGCSAAKGSVTS